MAAVEAVIDLAAVAHNVGVVRDRSGVDVMAVVKADGYGHGALPVARAALVAGAVEVGVATIDEALVLRRGGIGAPIAAWLHTPGADIEGAVRGDVEVVVSTPRQLAAVVAAAEATGQRAVVGVKVDTGLGRGGVGVAEWAAMVELVAKSVGQQSISLRSVMSHLAWADVPAHPCNDEQAEALAEFAGALRRAGAPPERMHIANSAAALTRRDLSFDLVRGGIAIYGRTPVPSVGDFGLVPAMTLTAEVSVVKAVAAGQGISYNHTWTAPRDTVVALLPCGYADGVPRLLSNKLTVWIDGRRYPNVGRVCMDQLVIDLGPDGGGVQEGDRAVLFGRGDRGEPTALEWARLTDTVDYEIVTGVRGRTVRRYVSSAGHPAPNPSFREDLGVGHLKELTP
jgi:alanine racemase